METKTMKQTINFTDFTNAFTAYNREDNFTYAGLRALFDYLEQLEDDLGEAIELDVTALCCEYTEYSSLADFQSDYGLDAYPHLDAIMEHTTLIAIDADSFIVADF